MKICRQLGLCLTAVVTLAAPPAVRANDTATDPGEQPLTGKELTHHVLSRLAFGPTPGLAEKVEQMGWQAWAKQQLDPASIEDGAVDYVLEDRWASLRLSMGQVFAEYRPPYKNDPPTDEERAMRNRLRQQVRTELPESVLYRAIHSERQFNEVICEFWRNHFNIDQGKDDVQYLAPHFEQHVIRRFAFDRFEHLLLASARHPAMLIYLDNDVSQKPLTDREQRLVDRFEGKQYKPRTVLGLGRQRGLNENYARELMELHTLGVDQGYTQRDVTELARILTGWTGGYDNPEDPAERQGRLMTSPAGRDYGFAFREGVHDDRPKVLLGTRFRGDGEAEGVRAVRLLAAHPNTAWFISHKLCRYLVNDEPDPALVRRVATVFRKTRGHLPSVYEAIIFDPEFIKRKNFRAKFKTPFEFVASAVRATGASSENLGELRHAIGRMGQPIYREEDPTGYEDTAEAWLDPGVLVYRWSFSLRLAQGRVKGVKIDDRFLERTRHMQASEMAEALIDRLLPGGMDDRLRTILTEEIERLGDHRAALGLVLGSPTFQQQ